MKLRVLWLDGDSPPDPLDIGPVTVFPAQSCEVAADYLESATEYPHWILVDLIAPQETDWSGKQSLVRYPGLEFIRRYAGTLSTKVNFAIYSVVLINEVRDEARSLGVSEIFTKPTFSLTQVLAELQYISASYVQEKLATDETYAIIDLTEDEVERRLYNIIKELRDIHQSSNGEMDDNDFAELQRAEAVLESGHAEKRVRALQTLLMIKYRLDIDSGFSVSYRRNASIEDARSMSTRDGDTETESADVVLLIHGIRTQAEWQERLREVLEEGGFREVKPAKYGYFDVIRFLLPIGGFRRKPIERIMEYVRAIKMRHSSVRLSVVAHSFGCYIVGRILEDYFDISFHRLILCGSVLPQDFGWHRLGIGRYSLVVNDCGYRDIWPILADSITWGYGASGRFGFGNVNVTDRFHNLTHSDFFQREFMKKFWLTALSSGSIVPADADRPTTAWLLSVLSVVKIRSLVLLTALGVILYHLAL